MSALTADRSAAEPARTSEGLAGGLLQALEQPATWPVALAGFLARGGLVAFLFPIVVLPTPAAVQADLAPLFVPFVFGQTSPGLVALTIVVGGLALAWLVLGGLVGAWADVALARSFGEPPEAPAGPDAGMPAPTLLPTARVLAARLLAHAPLAAALAWGALRIGEAGYRELVTPFEVATPLVIRIALAAPEALAVVGVAWLLGEAAGGLAAREIVLAGRTVPRAVVRGWVGLARRPFASLATVIATSLLLAVAVLPGLLAAGTAWSRLRMVLYDGRLADLLLPLGVFVALWLGALILAGVATAARSAIWTGVWLRR